MFMRGVFAFVLLLAVGLSQTLMACSCLESGPPCAAWGSADGVFLGRVVDISRFEITENSRYNVKAVYLRVRFLVESASRGVAVGTLEVTTSADSGGGCGYPFELNRRYVVYAGRDANGTFETSICSRTRRVENAAEDLAFLGGLANAPPDARVFGQLGF